MKSIIYSLLLLLCFPAFLHAQEKIDEELKPIILIMDGSGSMWGQIDGKPKIAIARSVVKSLTAKMDDEQPLALVAYGHRRKSDCEDIEQFMEAEVGNREKINQILAGINPVGKTPLANTALLVIEKLKLSGESATIILVSDGAESCGGDLCAVVKAAKEAGVDFVLHIVGFDIGESDKLALQCAAEAGEGQYLDAANGAELSEALETAVELDNELLAERLSVKVSKDGQLHDASVKIYREGEEQDFTSLRTYTKEKTNPAIFRIPPGTYHVQAVPIGTEVQSIWERELIVPEEGIKEVELDFTAGKLSIFTSGNGEIWDCVVNITAAGERKSVAGGRTYFSKNSNPLIEELSPGVYDVHLSAGKIEGSATSHTFKGVKVTSRKTLELSHNFEYGDLSVLATNNGELWDCVIQVNSLDGEKKKSVGGGRTYASPNSNPLTEKLSPGTYEVRYRPQHIHGEDWEYVESLVEIKVGESLELKQDYQTGKLRIGAEHEGKSQSIDVLIRSNGKTIYNKRISGSSKSEAREIVLMPGKYEFVVEAVRLAGASPRKFSASIEAGIVLEKYVDF
ncbi:MAG: VWA domain-containing protein [Bacteroidota bacterium]